MSGPSACGRGVRTQAIPPALDALRPPAGNPGGHSLLIVAHTHGTGAAVHDPGNLVPRAAASLPNHGSHPRAAGEETQIGSPNSRAMVLPEPSPTARRPAR